MNKITHLVGSARNLFTSSILFCLMMVSTAANGEAMPMPSFSKAFSPDTIGPGSVSTLTFTIDNSAVPAAVENLSFTDVLPAGVTLATPALASTSCVTPTLTAPDGGGTISLSGASVGAFASCTVTVDVTSAVPGLHTNVSGDLTSSTGNSGTASADLTVSTSLPGFSKSFSPSSVLLGQRSTLTFTIDNTANAAAVSNLDFTDSLPTGMVIASPANASTDCGTVLLPPTLTADPGTSIIVLDANGAGAFPAVAVGASCTVSVDVIATGIGSLDNITGDLLSDFTAVAGKASATLNVTAEELFFTKSFTDDPVAPGGTVTLRFDIFNTNRSSSATGISFSDDLNDMLTGTTVSSVDSDTCSGVPAGVGTGVFSYSGGSVAADGGNCEIILTLAIPGGATEGAYPNITSNLTASTGTFSPASEMLFVFAAPVISKTYKNDPVAGGTTTELEFTITNSSLTAPATAISFVDVVTDAMSGVTVNALPTAGFCGGGATMVNVGIPPEVELYMSGGDLAAGASCTFSVFLDVPVGYPANTYTNTTGPVTATISGTTRTGNQASDSLTVIGAPRLTKSFTDDPVVPGDTVNLEFTISQDVLASGPATAIGFSDNLDAALTGLAASGDPVTNNCGGTFDSSTANLSLVGGGQLDPDTSCTITVPLLVPAGALPGSYTNMTSNIVATVSGLSATGNPAQDDLQVAGLKLTMAFTDDPVLPGGVVNMRYTIDNTASAAGASSIFFTHSLSSIFAGTAAGVLPNAIVAGCGGSAALSGTTTLMFVGGDLAAGGSCILDVPVQLPAGITEGSYPSFTSSLSAIINASPVVLNPASDILSVVSDVLTLSKTFTDDPLMEGGTGTLQFVLGVLAAAPGTVDNIAFTDDLDDALTGLTFTGGTNDCPGLMLTPGPLVSVSGLSLAPGTSCTITLDLAVPVAAVPGAYPSTTSTLSGDIGGSLVSGPAASDTLQIGAIVLSQTITGSPMAGGTATLGFNLQNSGSTTINSLAFSNDLSGTISGLVATGLPMSNVCGTGSLFAGTSLLTLTGANLLPGGSCSFSATLQVPPSALAGTYTNTTSTVTSSGLFVASPATDTLTIIPTVPVFSKAFAPTSIVQGAVTTLTFTINNTASPDAATGLDFTDTMPAALTVASPANASTTCTGGTLTAVATTGSVSYSGGSVAAGTSCTVTVDVTGTSIGTHVNTTGDLTSSSGNSGTASANLTITLTPPPAFSKSFSPATIISGASSTLTFTVDNTSNYLEASALDFTDNLPGTMIVASPANASTTCTGGTLTAAPGSNVISYNAGSIAGWNSCTVQVDVTATASGSYVNTTGNLTSSLGNSGTASATLAVNVGDGDNDGVNDDIDQCPGTVIPESVPTVSQYAGYYALVDSDLTFDTINDPWRIKPGPTYTVDDTGGCSCEQIIAEQGLGQIFTEYGCALNVMHDWILQLPNFQVKK